MLKLDRNTARLLLHNARVDTKKYKLQVGCTMVYHERVVHNYLILCHRKYNTTTKHKKWDIRVVHDGKVECNIVECTTALLFSDWLYLLWHGITMFIFTGIILLITMILVCFNF